MKIGVDTTFLVQYEILEHPGHAAARDFFEKSLNSGDSFALIAQVLEEFLHVVTDVRRFERPLSMRRAVGSARKWWNAEEVSRIFPSDRTGELFFSLMERHDLGWKRILDTMCAAAYMAGGVSTLVSSNPSDFELFDGLEVLKPGA